MRHNWKKYQKRRSIREEWKKRLDDARKKSNQQDYACVVTEYLIITKKIRRYYDWLKFFTGRMC